MPTDNGLRLYDEKDPLPVGPKPLQHHPKQFVRSGKSRSRTPLAQDRKLLPKGQVFQKQVATRTDRSSEQNEQKPQQP